MMHIDSQKERTKNRTIESLPPPPLLSVPLVEKFGAKLRCLVQPGDRVLKYQPVAVPEKSRFACVHSPVSGLVRQITESVLADGSKVRMVQIENDFTQQEHPFEPIDPATATTGELLSLLENAGVVGEGGAEFPTALKYDTKGKQVDYLIVNGAECEPFLTGDYALMSQETKKLFEGIEIAQRLLNAGKIVIAIEDSNAELQEVLRPYLALPRYRSVSLRIVPDEYPQGGELQLCRTVTGREMAKGSVPLERGLIVSNVGTLCAVSDAVLKGRPVIDRIMTVTGEGTQKPGNYRVPIGTPVDYILSHCGINPHSCLVVSGGPMMSPHVVDFSVPVTKGMLGIVALHYREPKRLNCIWCGYCADVCPMKLMPMKYAEFHRRGRYQEMEKYNIGDCIDCASCEYICPSKVALMESIGAGKKYLKEKADAEK